MRIRFHVVLRSDWVLTIRDRWPNSTQLAESPYPFSGGAGHHELRHRTMNFVIGSAFSSRAAPALHPSVRSAHRIQGPASPCPQCGRGLIAAANSWVPRLTTGYRGAAVSWSAAVSSGIMCIIGCLPAPHVRPQGTSPQRISSRILTILPCSRNELRSARILHPMLPSRQGPW